jgi:hypothetical protein
LNKKGFMMKKIIFLFVIGCLVTSASALHISPTGTKPLAPDNVWFATLGDGTATNDSIAIAGSNVWGPFAISKDKSSPQATGMRLIVPVTGLLSGDSATVLYQFTATNKITDTTAAGWISMDTVSTLGVVGANVDISAKQAAGVFFKVLNLDATAIRMLKRWRIVFISTTTNTRVK